MSETNHDVMPLPMDRELLSAYLTEYAWYTEADNVREGIDLESYENELKLIGFMLRMLGRYNKRSINSPMPVDERKSFDAWWFASKYCQVIHHNDANQRIAWDGWEARAALQTAMGQQED